METANGCNVIPWGICPRQSTDAMSTEYLKLITLPPLGLPHFSLLLKPHFPPGVSALVLDFFSYLTGSGGNTANTDGNKGVVYGLGAQVATTSTCPYRLK